MNQIPEPSINIERLRENLYELSEIGRNPEDRGLYRTAFSKADMEARHWLMKKLKALNIPVKMDGAGNVLATMKGTHAIPRLVVGSHTDTVPKGGALDGSLGVLAALECVQSLLEKEVQLRGDVELVAFSDEEGRFGGMFGSEAYCGLISPERLEYFCEVEQQTLAQALRKCGMDPLRALEAKQDANAIGGYIELHIEQGPVLDHIGKPVGIVEGITGLFKWLLAFQGQSNHAGTTPMDLRNDALMGLAEFAFAISRILEENGTGESRATIGRAQILPGAANTVPGFVEFTLDVRDPDPTVIKQLQDAFTRSLHAICHRRGLDWSKEEQSLIPPVQCNSQIIEKLKAAAEKLKLDAHLMPSGAAHDAQIMANIAPIGMIFVPSKDGLSHSPAEWTDWDHIEAGANLLLQTIVGFFTE
jgi:N-carbamoyl-L-amino-acid hydrolase